MGVREKNLTVGKIIITVKEQPVKFRKIFFFIVKKNQSIILYSVTENYFSSLSTILTTVSKKNLQ